MVLKLPADQTTLRCSACTVTAAATRARKALLMEGMVDQLGTMGRWLKCLVFDVALTRKRQVAVGFLMFLSGALVSLQSHLRCCIRILPSRELANTKFDIPSRLRHDSALEACHAIKGKLIAGHYQTSLSGTHRQSLLRTLGARFLRTVDTCVSFES